MAGRFNLADYETVEERIRRFYAAYEDGRIVTEWENNNRFEVEAETKTPKTWVIRASIFLTAGDQANHLPKATGFAFEVDGTGGANNTSALENAETSAIGRALANMNLSGNKRASREEMAKVQRIQDAAAKWDPKKLEAATTVEQTRELWVEANRLGVGPEILASIKAKADSLAANS
jgi:hypothetical protein